MSLPRRVLCGCLVLAMVLHLAVVGHGCELRHGVCTAAACCGARTPAADCCPEGCCGRASADENSPPNPERPEGPNRRCPLCSAPPDVARSDDGRARIRDFTPIAPCSLEADVFTIPETAASGSDILPCAPHRPGPLANLTRLRV